MLLFVGLGNPGAAHAGQRHNVGFMALDAIARRHRFGPWKAKFQGAVAEGRLDGKKLLALKPQTYMNESGRSVGEALRYFDIPPDEVVVFHDEIDLAGGKVRIKAGGGAAGHNGLRSIAAHIGAGFRRVRIGVAHPGNAALVQRYVLNDFSKLETTWLLPLLRRLPTPRPCWRRARMAAS